MHGVATTILFAGLVDCQRATIFPIGLAALAVFVLSGFVFLFIRALKNYQQFVQARAELADAKKLSEQRLQLDAALNNMSQGLLMFDSLGRIVIVNRQYIEMYGLSPDVVQPGCTFHELICHRKETGSFSGDVEQYCADICAAIAQKKKTMSLIVELPNGRSIRIVNQPMATDGWVATHEDITVQRRAEQDRDRNREFLDLIIENVPVTIFAKQTSDCRYVLVIRRVPRIGLGTLPDSDQAWIASQIAQFPDLINMTRVDDGFMGMPKAQWVAPNPDARYDSLSGDERLKSLEAALSSARGEWDDNLAGRATDWIQQRGNQLKLITDLEEGPGDGADFPRVWERLGWAHSPGPAAGETSDPPRDLIGESNRVLSLLEQLPPKTIRQAVDGISQWLSAWEKQIVGTQKGLIVWLKVWPIAVEETNAKQPTEDELDLNTTVQPSGDQEPMDLDTLNTSVGKLVGVFLAACPSVKPGDQPFEDNAIQTQMRNAIEDSIGPSGLIVKYRLVESLFYFLNADLEWTKKHLIPPVLADSNDALILWRAVGRRTRFSQELPLGSLGAKDGQAAPSVARPARRMRAGGVTRVCRRSASLSLPEASRKELLRNSSSWPVLDGSLADPRHCKRGRQTKYAV